MVIIKKILYFIKKLFKKNRSYNYNNSFIIGYSNLEDDK